MPNITILAQGFLQLFCSQGPLWLKCLSLMRGIIQSNICRILPKLNQVIYTLDTNCMAKIMILAQAVIQILWSQGPLWVKCASLKRGRILSNIHRILQKVNQVIYNLYPNCMPNIMILSQEALRYLRHKVGLLYKMSKLDKGHNSAKYL